MKTDAQLKKDVQAELEWDPAISAAEVGVAAQGAAWLAPGINRVDNELRISP